MKKDLTFIHLGNDSKVEGLINFEKLRMIAKEVRHVCNMASAQYVSPNNACTLNPCAAKTVYIRFQAYCRLNKISQKHILW